MGRFLAYLRWLYYGDANPPVGVRVYRADGPIAFVWGNGTGPDAEIDKYKRLLEAWQREGVTVVGCETTEAWDGVVLAKAAKYARSLYGVKVVVGVGHSGGGGGVLTAGGKDASLFDRVVVMATGREVAQLPTCPALFVVGDRDTNIDVGDFMNLAKSYPGPHVIATHSLADHFTITRAAAAVALEFGTKGTVEVIVSDPYWTLIR